MIFYIFFYFFPSRLFKMDWVMLSILLLCLIAVFLYKCITFLEKRLTA